MQLYNTKSVEGWKGTSSLLEKNWGFQLLLYKYWTISMGVSFHLNSLIQHVSCQALISFVVLPLWLAVVQVANLWLAVMLMVKLLFKPIILLAFCKDNGHIQKNLPLQLHNHQIFYQSDCKTLCTTHPASWYVEVSQCVYNKWLFYLCWGLLLAEIVGRSQDPVL